MKTRRYLIFALSLTLSTLALGTPTPFPEPSSANALFQDRPFGPTPAPTPTPERKPVSLEEPTPIPTSWWIGGMVAAGLGILAFLYGATRAWRRSNLFEGQYRFPARAEAALRLGGMRSGGHMAVIRFGEGEPLSKTENT